jgi:hypothetical protein
MQKRLTILLAAFAAAYAVPALATDQIIDAPCAADPANLAGLRDCGSFMSGEPGTPGFLTQLKGVLQQNVERVSKTPSPTGTKSCAIVPNPLILKDGTPFSEEKVNRFGESCGDPMKITIRSNPLTVEFHKEYVAGKDVPIGSLEDSWLYGAQYQATAFYLADVSTEIQGQHKLTIRPYSQGPSYVAGMAKDYKTLLDARNKLFAIVSTQTNRKELMAALTDCRKATDPTQPQANLAVGQQASQLCAARMALERSFLNLAAAEVLGRASDSYLTQVGSADARTRMYQWIRDTMKMVCKDANSEAGANQCYQQNIGGKLREYLKNVWPITAQAPGTAPQTSQSGLAPGLLLMAGLGRRRRK